MFKKVLVANRGEIACRVIKACKELGISTVAVYSEADKGALHVELADEAKQIGPPPVAQSYLNMAKIIEVAKECGVDAIHPGYGLLAENPAFAKGCSDAGITFIGPPPEAMAAMGLKVEARRLMKEAGVPVVPGTEGLEDAENAKKAASEMGYPVMLKASAGGGGIGMQVVNSDDEIEKAFKMCQTRAKAYFANPTIYLEKFIENPRHVEVQVLADSGGKVLYLNERECSVQRRHQKVIEEAPSPAVDGELRRRMGEAAVAAAKAIGYVNAGTVEFLMDAEKNFYFLEMNTRIQVEHPVTEMTTGEDLVQWQIRIASGEPISLEQEEIPLNGHSIECRIYAEDPDKNFMPSPGKLARWEVPQVENTRIDTGVREGDTVTPYYDPLLAKFVSWGATRDEAIETMLKLLDGTKVEGIKTNIPFHLKALKSPLFRSGEIHTGFINLI